ncbi:hypothetical protein PIB30_054258 [Stylosanthes scabra]|uniref:Uncharacterized protein n=1 Tax=Stylosanthes scabra TaxID=79078 RepID=A0ABU6RJM0_9FABA|nr:hypothetical protein [Stylosanthes scabra]
MLPTSSTSLPTTHHFQPSFQPQANIAHNNHPRLVRKITRATDEKVKGNNEDKDFIGSQYNTQQGYHSGKPQHKKKNMVVGKKGKKEEKEEWVIDGDDEDPSQYFAKDYAHVGKRRPIHN